MADPWRSSQVNHLTLDQRSLSHAVDGETECNQPCKPLPSPPPLSPDTHTHNAELPLDLPTNLNFLTNQVSMPNLEHQYLI